jgi:hypothetical protein
LYQISPVHTTPSYFLKLHFNIIHPPTSCCSIVCGSVAIMTWRVLMLRMEETASRCGGQLRICWIRSRGQPTRSSHQLVANNFSSQEIGLLWNITKSLGPILWTKDQDKNIYISWLEFLNYTYAHFIPITGPC